MKKVLCAFLCAKDPIHVGLNDSKKTNELARKAITPFVGFEPFLWV